MSDQQPSSSIVSDDEIQAALAEAERQAAGIPSLDDGTVIPVEGPRMSPAPREPLVSAPPRPVPPPTMPPGPEPQAAPEAPPTDTAHGLVYRFLDTLLAAANWPFGWIPLPVRRLIGLVALATLAVAVAAVLVLPRVFPPRELVPRPAARATAAQTPPAEHAAPKAGH